jgi:predicted transcriptional regulator
MGKISEAFKRSGDVIDEKHFLKRTLNENALSPLEKRLLRRAGRHYERKKAPMSASGQNQQIPLSKKIESLLKDLGLDKAHISQQTIKELNQSLSRIDGYIARPNFFLKQNFGDTVNSEKDFKLYILPVLLERRRLVLETYDDLVGGIKDYDLRLLTKEISDTNVKSSIEKILNDLQKKNLILKKEYQKIEKARRDIYFEQQKFSSMHKESSENINKTSRFFPAGESMITWIMGTLLIFIALVIAIAPFANTPVPDIFNITFPIILGFFFGRGIGRFASFRETKK